MSDEEPIKFDGVYKLEIDPVEKIIYTYIAFNETGDVYYIYDPATDKHHEVTKEKYEEVMNIHKTLYDHVNS